MPRPRALSGSVVPAVSAVPIRPPSEPESPLAGAAPEPPALDPADRVSLPNEIDDEPVPCWDCDAPNPPGRMFCGECGTFIAVGAKAFSRTILDSGPRDSASADQPGPMSLGAYAVATRRRAARRRTRLATVSVGLVAVVALAFAYVVVSPGGRTQVPEPPVAAAVVTPSPGPTTALPSGMGLAEGLPELRGAALEAELEAVRGETEQASPPLTVAPVALAPTERPKTTAAVPAAEIADLGALVPATAAPAPVTPKAAQPPAEPTGSDGAQAAAAPRTVEPTMAPKAAKAAPEKRADAVVWRDGWVCGGVLRLDDARARDWTITRAAFLPSNGYERVILRLNRFGSGSGAPASLTAETVPTARVARSVPGVGRPSLGRTTVVLQFEDGVKTDVNLRAYRPGGLRSIKEFSAYPAGSGASRVLISSTSDGCFRVRTPDWRRAKGSNQAQIIIDIKS